jgi:hypothetical protein
MQENKNLTKFVSIFIIYINTIHHVTSFNGALVLGTAIWHVANVCSVARDIMCSLFLATNVPISKAFIVQLYKTQIQIFCMNYIYIYSICIRSTTLV